MLQYTQKYRHNLSRFKYIQPALRVNVWFTVPFLVMQGREELAIQGNTMIIHTGNNPIDKMVYVQVFKFLSLSGFVQNTAEKLLSVLTWMCSGGDVLPLVSQDEGGREIAAGRGWRLNNTRRLNNVIKCQGCVAGGQESSMATGMRRSARGIHVDPHPVKRKDEANAPLSPEG